MAKREIVKEARSSQPRGIKGNDDNGNDHDYHYSAYSRLNKGAIANAPKHTDEYMGVGFDAPGK